MDTVLSALNVPLTSVLNDSRMTVSTRRVVGGIEPRTPRPKNLAGTINKTVRRNHQSTETHPQGRNTGKSSGDCGESFD